MSRPIDLFNAVVDDFQWDVRRGRVKARAVIPGERLVVNDARALRQRLAVLGSAAK